MSKSKKGIEGQGSQDRVEPTIQRYDGYEIVYLDPVTNTKAAPTETAPYMVSLSGGLGSAVAGERAIARHGREQVAFWFADVLDEDEDLYRFVHDLMRRWRGRLYWYTDGRHPEEVWDQKHIIPNNLLAPCSMILKAAPFRAFVKAMPQLPVIYIGFKVGEARRQCHTLASYAKAIPEAVVDFPLLWTPVEHRSLLEVCQEEMGILPPKLYRLNFHYNNCGALCCRSGITSLVRAAYYFPDRYAAREAWEQRARSQGGARANRSIASRQKSGKKEPLTLTQIREEYLPNAKKLLKLGEEVCQR